MFDTILLFLFKKVFDISDYSVFNCLILFFSLIFFFIYDYAVFGLFFIFIFGFLVFFPPPYTLLTRVDLLKYLVLFILKRLKILSLTPPTFFRDLGI